MTFWAVMLPRGVWISIPPEEEGEVRRDVAGVRVWRLNVEVECAVRREERMWETNL